MTRVSLLVATALLALTAIACASEAPEVSTASGRVEGTTTSTQDTEEERASTTTTEERPSTTTTAPNVGVKVVVTEVGMFSEPGYDGQPRGIAGAVLTNEGDEAADFFEVVFTFKDPAGTAVGTTTTYVYAIDPGGIAYAAADSVSLQGEAVSVDASAIVRDDGFWQGTVIPVSVTAVTQGDYGLGITVTGTADNPGQTVIESAQVTCVLRAGGRIVGGVYTYLDTLAPAAQVAWEAHSLTENLTADAAECSGGVYE